MLLLALITLSGAVMVYGRIGETQAQCDQRYGTAVGTQKNGEVLYAKNGFLIGITFTDDICTGVFYAKRDGVNLSDEELQELLAANSNNGRRIWQVFGEGVWTSSDGLIATVDGDALTIEPRQRPSALRGF